MTPRVSDERLRAILALAEAATAGPWRWWTSNSYERLSSGATGKDGDVLCGALYRDGVVGIEGSQEDRAFIAAARSDVPDLARDLVDLRASSAAREAQLVAALEAAIKRCRCNGTSEYEPHCSRCDDSTEDHECPDSVPCTYCVPYRTALAPGSAFLVATRALVAAQRAEREASGALSEHNATCEACGEFEGNRCRNGCVLFDYWRECKAVTDERAAKVGALVGDAPGGDR